MQISEIMELSIPERIQLVEEIWDTIDQNAVELTESEKRLIDLRISKHLKNPNEGSSWQEVFAKVTSRK